MSETTDESAKLGAHIRKLREGKGLSVRGLAAAATIDATYLSRLEHGMYESPDPRYLYRLARALDVEVAELYLTAGYGDGRGLPGLAPYLRAKYDLPDEAVAQLEAHFDLINERYLNQKGDHHGSRHHPPA
jgi:transcriptional regulator with XRE-family HTH domain